MFIGKFDNILIFYSIEKSGYAGWKQQVSRLFSYVSNSVEEFYYSPRDLLCFLLKVILKSRTRSLFVLPNLYGINKMLWLLLRLFGAKVLPRVSGGELNYFERNRGLARILRHSSVWVLNKADYNRARKLGFRPYIINNSVDVPESIDLKREGFNFNQGTILMCGSICRRKGQYEILDWLDRLNFNGNVYLVGPREDVEGEGGTYIQQVESLINELRYSVVITGERSDLKSYYMSSDILILNSEFEGLPNVVLESLVYGLPVIGSDVQGTRDILNQIDNNLLYEYGCFTSFSNSLSWVSKDRNYQSVVSKSRIVIKDNYSVTNVLAQLDSVCLEIF